MTEKPNTLRTIFAKNVKHNLEKLGVSPTRFSKSLSIGGGFFRNVLKGDRNISLDNCNEIIDELRKLSVEKNIKIKDEYFTD